MFLIRMSLMALTVVVAIVLAAVTNAWWLLGVAIAVLIAMTTTAALALNHYIDANDWPGPTEEEQLELFNLVEADTGLPTRRRFDERRAQAYAERVARRGRIAVPMAWRGPDGAHRLLLVTTGVVTARELRAALPASIAGEELAVLVVVPTLARGRLAFRLGAPVEAVGHAETVLRDTVDALRDAGMHVSGHIGPSDPAVAVSDGLRTYDAERVIVARDHTGARRYLEDVPVHDAAEAFHVPLTEVTPIAAG